MQTPTRRVVVFSLSATGAQAGKELEKGISLAETYVQAPGPRGEAECWSCGAVGWLQEPPTLV